MATFYVGCVGSRVNTEQSVERAKRILTALNHPRLIKGNKIVLVHTGKSFEKHIMDWGYAKHRTEGLRIEGVNNTQLFMKWLNSIHPASTKLSKRAIKDFHLAAMVVEKSHVIMASPRIKGRGRADFALKLAAACNVPVFDLTDDNNLKQVNKLELKNKEYDANLKKELKLQEQTKNKFIEELKKELRVYDLSERDTDISINLALALRAEGKIKSPKIRSLVTYGWGTPKIRFMDEVEEDVLERPVEDHNPPHRRGVLNWADILVAQQHAPEEGPIEMPAFGTFRVEEAPYYPMPQAGAIGMDVPGEVEVALDNNDDEEF